MRRGVTLIELLIVLVLTGMLAMIATPRLLALRDALALRDEVGRVVAALDLARGTAIRLGGRVGLDLSDTGYVVTALSSDAAFVAWSAPGAGARGQQISGAGGSILFGPAGLAVGASNRTITLSRGGVTRRVVISRLGRISW